MNGRAGFTRRALLGRSALGLGSAALASLLGSRGVAQARAKRVIYLLQAGAPAQQELFDPKPLLNELHGQPLPAHVRGEQRLTGMSAQQAALSLAGSPFAFAQHGHSGAWVSELLPHTARIVDRLCIVRSMWTEAINHDPAITYLQTGSQLAGRPSLGSWASYGLGSDNQDLPAFVVLVSAGQADQPLYARLWGSGFLDARHEGVRFREGRDAVLYLANPPGVDAQSRARLVGAVQELERLQRERELDPAIEARIAQYELAHRMQSSVPEVTDLATEPDSTFELYGEDARKPGTYAANCLLARRLAERGVRFVQLYHQGWDHHDNLPEAIRGQALETDQASAALVLDLERRGLLEDTLVVWGGEFGRTSYCQGKLGATTYGRDHHPRCFTIWLAGAGVRAGTTYGATDDYGYNLVDAHGAPLEPSKLARTPGAVHVHDLQATLLHLLGLDHEALSVMHLGRRFRLTDVHGHVVPDLLA
jgi:hypothetical protein